MNESHERSLSESEKRSVDEARAKAFVLYEGKQVAHRSCGIALAETFGVASGSYQALRRGGITGEGECGAIKAGELLLGELLGDPDPAGAVTDSLRSAARLYRELWQKRLELGPGGSADCIVCNRLTEPLGDFMGEARQTFCTNLAAEVAATVAEVLVRHGVQPMIEPLKSES